MRESVTKYARMCYQICVKSVTKYAWISRLINKVYQQADKGFPVFPFI